MPQFASNHFAHFNHFQYHPHHHGSTAVQVGGGAAGAIIVEANEFEIPSFPEWYTNLTDTEIVLVIQRLDFSEVADIGDGVDNLFTFDVDIRTTVVNGEYQPTICMEAGVWKKWRIVHSNLAITENTYTLDAGCSLYLLSKDGVLIHGLNNEV